MTMFNKFLGRAPLFKDAVKAIANLTKTANELVKGYTQLAKMVIEDRKAINDIYAVQTELFALLEGQQVKPMSPSAKIDVKPGIGLGQNDQPKKKTEMN